MTPTLTAPASAAAATSRSGPYSGGAPPPSPHRRRIGGPLLPVLATVLLQAAPAGATEAGTVYGVPAADHLSGVAVL
ncbi:hypothetical protein ABZ371_32815, partial [Streptomyces sp. NPDC005899]